MQNYDRDNIKEAVVEQAKELRQKKGIDPELIGQQSAICGHISKWGIAVLDYYDTRMALNLPEGSRKSRSNSPVKGSQALSIQE